MPLDGLYLACVREELSGTLETARITRVYQPGKRELSISFRRPGSNHLLLISCHPQMARIHLARDPGDNPRQPPPFCMLLRKHWEGGRLVRITQPHLERILVLQCQNIDEFGLVSRTELICEFMGKHSNVILVKGNDGGGRKVLGSLIPVYPGMSRVRTLLTGEPYTAPPPQEKFFIANLGGNRDLLRERLEEFGNKSLKNALVEVLQGFGPATAEALALRSGLQPGLPTQDLDPSGFTTLWESLLNLKESYEIKEFHPTLLSRPQGDVVDFSALPLKEGDGLVVEEFKSPSALLDYFFSQREKLSRETELRARLEQVVAKELERLRRRRKRQERELAEAGKGENYRKQGEALTAYLHKVRKGSSHVVVPDPYHPEGEPLEISLEPSLSPSQNAQRYFKRYKKAVTAEKELSRRIGQAKLEIRYLESLQFQLEGGGAEELAALRDELEKEGYIKDPRTARTKGPPGGGPLKFLSSDGIVIRVGKNNRQNDLLTLKIAEKEHLWFHTKDLPGSHVIVSRSSPPYKTLEEAALLAAYYSRGKNSANVPVDYTRVKNVRKPKGAKPGMVIYDNHKTLYVTPEKDKLPAPTP